MIVVHNIILLCLEDLPSELDEMECSECRGDCFIDCLDCGGDGDVECPVCGGMGEKCVQEDDDSDVCDVDYECDNEDDDDGGGGYGEGNEVSTGVRQTIMGIDDCENCDGGQVECQYCGGLGKGESCKSCTNGVYKKFTVKRYEKVTIKKSRRPFYQLTCNNDDQSATA